MKKNNILLIVGVAVVFLFAGVLIGMPADLEPVVKDEVGTNSPVEHESEWRESFVGGCVTEDATEAECTCMYDWLRARYTIGEMAQMAVETDSDATQMVIYEAAGSCSDNE